MAAAVPDAQSPQTCAISRARPPALPAAQIGGDARVLHDPPVSLSVTAGQGADARGSRILLRPDPLDDSSSASILRLWTAQGLQALGRQRPSRSTALEPRRHPGVPSGRGSRSPLALCPATKFTAMGDGPCIMQTDGDARATAVPEDPVGGMNAYFHAGPPCINMQAVDKPVVVAIGRVQRLPTRRRPLAPRAKYPPIWSAARVPSQAF